MKAASHLEVLREQMTREESEYLARVQMFETDEIQVQSLEVKCREAKTLLRSPVPSVHQSNGGSDDEVEEDGKIG